MKKIRALVLSGYGINCEQEMAKGAELAGADVQIVHAKAWLLDQVQLSNFDFLLFPGGFSFGDELGAAKAFANRISFSKKSDELLTFIDQGKCILGVCNGFQLLTKLGILPGGGSQAALVRNQKGKFEARWVHQKVLPSPCIFTSGVTDLYLPVRHGEGNFVLADQSRFSGTQIVLQYATAEKEETTNYPDNPNGSAQAISAICDPTGRILGMMPHPEAALLFTQLPNWIRQKEENRRKGIPVPTFGPGLSLFKNAVTYLRNR